MVSVVVCDRCGLSRPCSYCRSIKEWLCADCLTVFLNKNRDLYL